MTDPDSDLDTASTPSAEEKNWALAAHLGPLIVAAVGGPLAFLAPLVIWLVKKEESPFIADQAVESLNFQITLFIAYLICVPFVFILIGIPMLALVWLAQIALGIVASVKAGGGEPYRYPFSIRLIH